MPRADPRHRDSRLSMNLPGGIVLIETPNKASWTIVYENVKPIHFNPSFNFAIAASKFSMEPAHADQFPAPSSALIRILVRYSGSDLVDARASHCLILRLACVLRYVITASTACSS